MCAVNMQLPSCVGKYRREPHYIECSVIDNFEHTCYVYVMIAKSTRCDLFSQAIKAPPAGFLMCFDLGTVIANGSMIQFAAPGFSFHSGQGQLLFC